MIHFDCSRTRPDFLFNVAFNAGSGITALFGPSGSGKSTVIRMLAGLEKVDRGRIAFSETCVLDTASGIAVPPHRRRIGLVYQDAQLLPHLSVRANLLYGYWFTPASERRISLDSVVDVLGIGHLFQRRIASLSGGETQRVAIGRAILTAPHLLLMDEPLASLDAGRKQEILPFIERLRDEFGIPVIYVSHSAEEVARLAAHVVMLDQGKVVAVGPPGEILSRMPPTGAGDRFSMMSVLAGRITRTIPEHGATVVDHPAGQIVLPGRLDAPGRNVRIAIRATNVALALGDPGAVSVRTILKGRVERIDTDASPFALVQLRLEGGDALAASITRLALHDLQLEPGMPVRALVKSASFSDVGIAGQSGNSASG